MTYIVGFIENEDIILISDTAITTENDIKIAPHTSFEEKPVKLNGKLIYQSEIKLFNISNDILIGGAGESHPIDNFVDNLNTYRNLYKLSLTKSIEAALDAIDNNEFELLIAYLDADNKPLLKIKDSHSKKLMNCEAFGSIGCEKTHHKNFWKDYQELRNNPTYKNCTLSKKMITCTSILQGYSLFDDILSEGVGGIFTSISLSQKKIQWQPSVGFITFSTKQELHSNLECISKINLGAIYEDSKYIFIAEKNNAFYIASPKPAFTGALFNNLNYKCQDDKIKWYEDNIDIIFENYTNLNVNFFVLVSRNNRVISIFEKKELQNRLIELQFGEKIKFKANATTEDDINFLFKLINSFGKSLDSHLTLYL
ncbi:MAG: hypothetical protein ACEPOW_14415 [Bacteroidales bacterium]